MIKKLLYGLLLLSLSTSIALAQGSVTGQVLDQTDGSPLPGVTVTQKGTTNGTSTDGDGNYSIDIGGDGLGFGP